MRASIATFLATMLIASSATAAFGAAAPPNDDMLNATTITGLPFVETVGLSNATTEPGENIDCVFPSAKTVWYRYVVPANQLISVDLSGSDPDAGVRIYFDYNDTGPVLGYCVSMQYSPQKLFIGPNLTMFFQLSVDAGSSATLSITSLPLLSVSSTLDSVVTINAKAGTVAVSGTITCNIPAYASAFVTIHQRQGRTVLVAQAYGNQVACGPTPTQWSGTGFGSLTTGPATADWVANAYVPEPPSQFAYQTGGPITVSIRKR